MQMTGENVYRNMAFSDISLFKVYFLKSKQESNIYVTLLENVLTFL